MKSQIAKHFAGKSFNSPLKQVRPGSERLVPNGYTLGGRVLKPGQTPTESKKSATKKAMPTQSKMQDSIAGLSIEHRKEVYKNDPNVDRLKEANIFTKMNIK